MKNTLLTMLTLVVLFFGGASVATPINVNQASAEQIAESLQGVGLQKANAIVQYRSKHGDFQSKNDLLNVKGIGAETLDKNKSNILLK